MSTNTGAEYVNGPILAIVNRDWRFDEALRITGKREWRVARAWPRLMSNVD
jgi:hypothetical protein